MIPKILSESKSIQDENGTQNPRENGSWFSKLYFLWVIPMIVKGYRGSDDLKADSFIPPVPSTDSIEVLGRKLETLWEEERKRKNSRLYKSVIRFCIKDYLTIVFIHVVFICLIQILEAHLVGCLIAHYTKDGGDNLRVRETSYGITVTMNLVVCITIFSSLSPLCSFFQRRVGLRIRSALYYLIYDKVLKFNVNKYRGGGESEISNLITNDVNRFDTYVFALPLIFTVPAQLLFTTIYLYYFIGVSGLTGILFIILIVPVLRLIGIWFGRIRRETAKKMDVRFKFLGDLVNGISLIKLFAWEKPFYNFVSDARKQELKYIRKKFRVTAIYRSMLDALSKVAVILTIFVFLKYGGIEVTAKNGFLTKPEIPRVEVPTRQPMILIKNFYCGWKSSHSSFAVKNINIQLTKSGDHVGIVGPVGAGKTTLIQGILEELETLDGHVHISGSRAYCSQSPTIFPDTVRNNIIFGLPFKPEWYDQVLRCTELMNDIEGFSDGDQTFIGDKGVTLSGGQRARVQLARGVYADSSMYLLDDPFCSLDARVTKSIYEKVICGLLKDKLVIIVSSQLKHLDSCKEIIYMENGEILSRGSMDVIMSIHYGSSTESNEEETPIDLDVLLEKESEEGDIPALQIDEPKSYGTFKTRVEGSSRKTEETSGTSSMELKLYWKYLRLGSSIGGLILFIILLIFSQFFYNYTNYWLKLWTEAGSPEEDNYFIREYVVLLIVFLIFDTAMYLKLYGITLRASQNMHDRMLRSIVLAPLSFFETNGTGRILNRFSTDTGIMDEEFPDRLGMIMTLICQNIGAGVLVFSMSPIMLLFGILLVVAALFVRKFALPAARILRRLQATSRSPIYSDFDSTLHGLSTIRTFKAQKYFMDKFLSRVNNHISTTYCLTGAMMWLAGTVDWIGNIYFFCLLASFTFMDVDGSQVGLALTSGLLIIQSIPTIILRSTDMETSFISFERIMEYMNIPSEAPLSYRGRFSPSGWPNEGKIDMNGVIAHYGSKESSPVLQGINCKIKPGEKIGLVGRTGAGKSTLVSVMLRLIEPTLGHIHIDNIDTQYLGLHDLRTGISIIPQDPVLFLGSIRNNLDPLDIYKDEEIWKVLEKVSLKERFVKSKGLGTEVDSGGKNFSVGERQLISFARVLLRPSKIVIMDEAAAFLDPDTKNLIQQLISDSFSNCTVITIAHLLDTVVGSDKIIFIEKGKVEEFGHPFDLLQIEGGRFRTLVENTGKASFNRLMEQAARQK